MSFSIVPTLSNGIGYKTMLYCLSNDLSYGDYCKYAKQVKTFTVHIDAYYLAQELLNAEINYCESEKYNRVRAHTF